MTSLLVAVLAWLLVCAAFWAGYASAGRPLPRPTGRHRRIEWDYEREDGCETPLPLPPGVVGFSPTGPRGFPTWSEQLTEPMPVVIRR